MAARFKERLGAVIGAESAINSRHVRLYRAFGKVEFFTDAFDRRALG